MRWLALVAIVGSSICGATARAQQPSLVTLLDAYSRGEYDEAVRRAAAIDDLGPLRVRFVQDVPVWIRAEPAAVDQRRAAAAAFLLELAHARLESDWGRLADLIEFTCVELRTGTAPTPFERAWYRASVALAGRARARRWLLGEFAVLPHQPPRRRPPSSTPDPNPKHLMHALERFPDDPRLGLDRIVAWTWGRDAEPIRNVRERDDETVPFSRRAAPQREAVKALEALVADPAIGAEASLRIAQLDLSMASPAAALPAAERAASAAASRDVRYLSLLFAGRALEALQQPSEAVGKYTAALDVLPGAESATLALASLQFVQDERESAVASISRAFEKSETTIDPGRLVAYGSFMHWAQLQADLRAELRR
jgi:tetratricopeptide (TPR) repeat protein